MYVCSHFMTFPFVPTYTYFLGYCKANKISNTISSSPRRISGRKIFSIVRLTTVCVHDLQYFWLKIGNIRRF
jgi:hypothetical protein